MVDKVNGKQGSQQSEKSTASAAENQKAQNAKIKKLNIYGSIDENGNGIVEQPELEKAMDGFQSTFGANSNARMTAMMNGYRPTDNPYFFYDDKTKKHYIVDKNGDLLEAKDVSWVGKDGSYAKRTKGKNGTQKYVAYDKSSYPKEMKAFDASGKKLVGNAKDSAAALGLRTTLATDSKGVYYDESTKIHYQWDAKTNSFKAMKDVGMIAADGETFDKKGKNQYGSRLIKGGQVVDKDGFISTIKHSTDKNGNRVTTVTDKLAPGETGDVSSRKTVIEMVDNEPLVMSEEIHYQDGSKEVKTRDKKTMEFTTVRTGYVVTEDANHNVKKEPYKYIE